MKAPGDEGARRDRAGAAGRARFTLPIPNAPQLVGQRFQHQALVLDPGHNGGLGLGAVVSDAMEGVIGRR